MLYLCVYVCDCVYIGHKTRKIIKWEKEIFLKKLGGGEFEICYFYMYEYFACLSVCLSVHYKHGGLQRPERSVGSPRD